MYFIFSNVWNDSPELRIYCNKNVPFKILYGKEQLKKSDSRYCDYSGWLQSLYYEITNVIKK